MFRRLTDKLGATPAWLPSAWQGELPATDWQWSSEWQDSVKEELDCQERKTSHLAPAKRELERHLEWTIEGQLPFATAQAPGRAARTFVAVGKKPLGVLI